MQTRNFISIMMMAALVLMLSFPFSLFAKNQFYVLFMDGEPAVASPQAMGSFPPGSRNLDFLDPGPDHWSWEMRMKHSLRHFRNVHLKILAGCGDQYMFPAPQCLLYNEVFQEGLLEPCHITNIQTHLRWLGNQGSLTEVDEGGIGLVEERMRERGPVVKPWEPYEPPMRPGDLPRPRGLDSTDVAIFFIHGIVVPDGDGYSLCINPSTGPCYQEGAFDTLHTDELVGMIREAVGPRATAIIMINTSSARTFYSEVEAAEFGKWWFFSACDSGEWSQIADNSGPGNNPYYVLENFCGEPHPEINVNQAKALSGYDFEHHNIAPSVDLSGNGWASFWEILTYAVEDNSFDGWWHYYKMHPSFHQAAPDFNVYRALSTPEPLRVCYRAIPPQGCGVIPGKRWVHIVYEGEPDRTYYLGTTNHDPAVSSTQEPFQIVGYDSVSTLPICYGVYTKEPVPVVDVWTTDDGLVTVQPIYGPYQGGFDVCVPASVGKDLIICDADLGPFSEPMFVDEILPAAPPGEPGGPDGIATLSTEEEPGANQLPETYALYQNYPNPFNPTTTIQFDLKEAGFVSLKVYDLIGREVVTLVNGTVSAGTHSAVWDASSMPSGIYLYRMETGTFRDAKRLVLLK